MNILVCYLVAPGEAYAECATRFVQSYGEHRAGIRHEVLMVVKQGAQTPPLEPWPVCQIQNHDNRGLDIGSLLQVAGESDHDLLMWLGSWSRILVDRWLDKLVQVGRHRTVGAVGITGSFEAGVSMQRPNPHIRTSAFMSKPKLLRSVARTMDTKVDTYEFEHGRDSLYRQLTARGLHCPVVGADGRAYHAKDWAVSNTFRHGDQANLLIADNHTDHFASAPAEEREVLAQMAGWGS